jgi:hypothetical protein
MHFVVEQERVVDQNQGTSLTAWSSVASALAARGNIMAARWNPTDGTEQYSVDIVLELIDADTIRARTYDASGNLSRFNFIDTWTRESVATEHFPYLDTIRALLNNETPARGSFREVTR